MGLGAPTRGRGGTGRRTDAGTLGGAQTHTETSGVAHYAVADDPSCLTKLRELVAMLPAQRTLGATSDHEPDAEHLYDLLPSDHRMSYDMHDLLGALVDDSRIDEFQPGLAREIICGDVHIRGIGVGLIAIQRGLIKGREG